jgi:hypothetical protein
MSSLSVIDGVEVVEDGDVTTFRPVEKPDAEKPDEKPDARSWLRKAWDWFAGSAVRPYVKVRDLGDPFGDRPSGGGSARGIEAGVKVGF